MDPLGKVYIVDMAFRCQAEPQVIGVGMCAWVEGLMVDLFTYLVQSFNSFSDAHRRRRLGLGL